MPLWVWWVPAISGAVAGYWTAVWILTRRVRREARENEDRRRRALDRIKREGKVTYGPAGDV